MQHTARPAPGEAPPRGLAAVAVLRRRGRLHDGRLLLLARIAQSEVGGPHGNGAAKSKPSRKRGPAGVTQGGHCGFVTLRQPAPLAAGPLGNDHSRSTQL